MKLNKKILLPFGTLAVLSAPIVVAISCSEETTAEENGEKNAIDGIQNLIIQEFIADSNKKAFDKNFDKEEEKAWNFWASHQLLKKPSFWIDKVNSLLDDGSIDKSYVTNKDWINAQDDKTKKNPKNINEIDRNYYPSWTIAKEIMKKNPNLLWKLEVNKLLLVQRRLTKTDGKLLQNLYKDKKEKDILRNLITLDNWKKVIANNSKDLPKDSQLQYFFLTKYLKESTPTLVWKRTFSGPTWGQSYINDLDKYKIWDVKTYNDLGGVKTKSLFEENFVHSSILKTSKGMANLSIQKLYGFKNISKTGFSKGELDYSDIGLKKRVKGSESEAGFVDKDGNIQQPNNKKEAIKMIVDNKKVTAEFVMQFIPWFDAKNKDGKDITDPKNISDANNDKSIFRVDEKLINDKDNLQKLIFTLSMSDSSLFTSAKTWLTKGKGEWITTGNEELQNKLKEEGLVQ